MEPKERPSPSLLSWNELPVDLWRLVVGFLTEKGNLDGKNAVQGVIRLRLVSRDLRQAVNEGLKGLNLNYFRREEELVGTGLLVDTSLLSALARGCTGLEWLDLSACYSIDDASLKCLSQLTNLSYLNVASTNVTDSGLQHLAGMTRLKELDLGNMEITDDGVKWLAGLTSLTSLDVSTNDLTDDGLVYLQGLTRLIELDISRNEYLGDPLRHLSTMTQLEKLELDFLEAIGPTLHLLSNHPALTWLSLCGADIADDDLERCVPSLSNLHYLDLALTAITNDGFAHLAGATKMKRLLVDSVSIDDSGLAYLSSMVDLEELNLSSTAVTGTGLVHLHNCSRLKSVGLKYCTRLTEDGMACIAELSGLKELDLAWSSVSDSGLMYLAGMKDLMVNIENTRVTCTSGDAKIVLGEWIDANREGTSPADRLSTPPELE